MTIQAPLAAPSVLYSVITDYGHGHIVAEHYTSRQARMDSLVDRAEMFFTDSAHIPEIVLANENRLAAMVSTLLMPAAITLTESRLNADDGVYRPSGYSSILPVK